MKEIVLYAGEICLVDDDDFEFLNQWKWRATGLPKNRAVSRHVPKNGRYIWVFMHRVITNAGPGEVVDHINHNTFDNRKCNLRVCKNWENDRNRLPKCHSSRFKGVYYDKQRKQWVAHARVKGKSIYLGRYSDELEAAKAYDCFAVENYKEFACTNVQTFPDLFK